MNALRVALDFSTAPGPRYKGEGHNSGEEFREDLLLPKLKKAIADNAILTVILDGTSGYGTSFLEESFGGLIRVDKLPLIIIRKHLALESNEEPTLITEINEYLEDAEAAEGDSKE